MQSLKSERAKKEYEQFVKEVTPKQNLFCNMAKAFIVGGLICVVGQILLHIGKTQFSLSKAGDRDERTAAGKGDDFLIDVEAG